MSPFVYVFQFATSFFALMTAGYGVYACFVAFEDTWYTRFNMRVGVTLVVVFQLLAFAAMVGF